MKPNIVCTILIAATLFSGCQEDKNVKQSVKATDIILEPAVIVKDTLGIAKDTFTGGDYQFAESVEQFRDRFNTYMAKSGWDSRLKPGTVTKGKYSICTMPVTESISIEAKLNKEGAVIKIVLVGIHDYITYNTPQLMQVMKGMIASGPVHRYITIDDIDVILFQIGIMSDEKIFPKGIWRQDGVQYEVHVEKGRLLFGINCY
ncbi:hypothetical protein CHU92_11400 [Flavobacterium cyanobacteriorum]|uniref:Uncharacterized protein n=1 Tax=Flavobacterium cyanobacteriorum TaxID=2022802 RepID=A0A255YZT9_9FLAO|nr:hypothetical protein [Flavobacterium cyanobacteriorum]OYQ34732.1 hypothetical protein CHU92_11400 [Flavobacterium cyanobacteriorum]